MKLSAIAPFAERDHTREAHANRIKQRSDDHQNGYDDFGVTGGFFDSFQTNSRWPCDRWVSRRRRSPGEGVPWLPRNPSAAPQPACQYESRPRLPARSGDQRKYGCVAHCPSHRSSNRAPSHRGDPDAVTLDDFTAAIERIVAGLEKKSRVLGPAERSRVAHHEMGHALVAATLPGVDPVHKVSIIPRGVGALGYTMQRPTQDRFLLARQELENRIAVLMGGRAAGALIFDGEVSTGASDDLQRATEIALQMV